MPCIRVLPDSLINKISAGEVVERPASVVKELIDNSIDAGSKTIDIEIAKAGKRLIRVADDGIGMDKEDALMCFLPHATSKISSEEDLYSIKTLGFRGEALSSIAAVSRLTITTATANKEGITVKVEGGLLKEVSPSACKGTVVEVRELFFNTPARLKFLKRDTTETNHVLETITNISLCQETVSFSLLIDSVKAFDLPKAIDTRERIIQVFGKDLADRILEARASNDYAEVVLFVGDKGLYRHNRKGQYLFVNRRPIRDPLLVRAIYTALDGYIPKEQHPVFFAYISINPSYVDFNVHPAKTEVRFSDKDAVFNLLLRAAKEAYGKTIKTEGFKASSLQDDDSSSFSTPVSYPLSVAEQGLLYHASETSDIELIYVADTIAVIADSKGLTLIDYHAVHERINYERLLKRQCHRRVLLFPLTVKLDHRLYTIALANIELIESFGIELEDFGSGSVIVRTIPDFLEAVNLEILLRDLIEVLADSRDYGDSDTADNPLEQTKKKLASLIACHSSLRGKAQRPTKSELVHLLKELDNTHDPDRCPHGRPTRVHLSNRDILRMFQRL